MSMLFKRIKDWATSITAFRTGDVIPVDGPDGTAKMAKDSLLRVTAENARKDLVKPSVIDFMVSNENGESVLVIKDGFEETKRKKFEQGTYVDFSLHNGSNCLFFLRNGLPYFKGFNFSKNSFVDFGIKGKDGKWIFCIKDGKLITGSENGTDYYKTCKNFGKSVGVFGGSLSVYPESETAKDLWRKNLAMDVTSYGVGGAGFSSLQGTSIQQQVDGAAKKDVYVLWASTNDYTHNREIGNYTDYTYLDNYDTSKLVSQCGGINYCIKKLYEKNPLAEVYFFTGIDFFSDEGGYNPFTQQTNSLGYTYQEYVDAQKKCCELFSIPVLDQNALSGLNIFNYTSFFKNDNLHMTEDGYRKIGMQQVQFLANGLT